jgi:hypothetical protein
MPSIGNHVTGAIEFARLDIRIDLIEEIPPCADRHHDLFNRRIAGPLADPVYSSFHLPRSVYHARKRIRHRKAQIVVAVDA